MTPAETLAQATADGLTLTLEAPDRLRVTGPAEARARLLPEIRAHKPGLVALLAGAPTPDPDPPRWRYLIRHPDGRLVEHDFCPEATPAQVRAWYPGALSIAPMDDEPQADPPEPHEDPTPDDRRTCRQCSRLTTDERCMGADELPHVMRPYHPITDRLHRCAAYRPHPDDPDQRPGRDRWPGQARRAKC